MKLDAKIPEGPLEDKWFNYKKNARLVNPANRKKLDVIVIGTGLAGSSVAASLGEMGYNVKSFCFQDTPRRAHSVAAQGGVNAAKNYKNDGDSIYRMFVDTLKGGDFRAREANVYRLAECSVNLIDQAVAQGVPFGREYGGYLNNRSFGGVQVSRTFYARGQTGQQLLLGTYQALMRQVNKKTVELFSSHEMLDLVVIDGKARGVIVRNLETGEIERHAAHAVVLATGGFGKIYYLSTLAMGCNGSAIWRAHKKGAYFASPSWTQIHPTSLPQSGDYQSKLTLMSESLRNDGRIWVPKNLNETRVANDIPEEERDYYLEKGFIGGEFKLGIIPTVTPTLLPMFIKSFVGKYPKVHLIIEEYTTEEIITRLRGGYLDAAIVATPLELEDIREKVLYYEPFVGYIPQSFQQEFDGKLTTDQLDLKKLLLLQDGHCFRDGIINICKNKSADTDRPFSLESGSFETLIQLSKEGLGYTLLPYLHTLQLNTEDQRNLMQFATPQPAREISLIHTTNDLKLQIIQALHETILGIIRGAIAFQDVKIISPKKK